MRAYFTLLMLFAMIGLGLQAQSIDVIEDDVNIRFEIDTTKYQDVPAYARIINNGMLSKDFYWVRTINEISDHWTSAVCIGEHCFLESVGKRSLTINPGDTIDLSVHLYTNAKNGDTASISISIWDADQTMEFASVTTTFSGSLISAIKDHYDESFNIVIAPNPVQDYVTFKGDMSKVNKIDVYNLLGSKMRTFNDMQSRYNVSDLSEGIYLVRFQDRNGRTLRTSRMTKR